jgi:hypothetical protein
MLAVGKPPLVKKPVLLFSHWSLVISWWLVVGGRDAINRVCTLVVDNQQLTTNNQPANDK